MRSVIFNQCRDRRMGVMWLDLGALTTARAIESSDRMERTESLLTLLLTLCGLTNQKTHRGGLGLGGSVHYVYFTSEHIRLFTF